MKIFQNEGIAGKEMDVLQESKKIDWKEFVKCTTCASKVKNGNFVSF